MDKMIAFGENEREETFNELVHIVKIAAAFFYLIY